MTNKLGTMLPKNTSYMTNKVTNFAKRKGIDPTMVKGMSQFASFASKDAKSAATLGLGAAVVGTGLLAMSQRK